LNAILDQTLCPSSHAKILKLIDSNQNGIIEVLTTHPTLGSSIFQAKRDLQELGRIEQNERKSRLATSQNNRNPIPVMDLSFATKYCSHFENLNFNPDKSK